MTEVFKGWGQVMVAVAVMSLALGCDQQAATPQETGDGPSAPASTVTGDATESAEFVRMVTMTCLLSRQSSELVLEKGIEGEERVLAENVREHSPHMLASLQQIAEQKGIALPEGLDDAHQARLGQLTQLETDALAAAYHDLQADLHRDLIQLLTNASQNLQDGDLQAWAKQHLSQAQAHLRELTAHDHAH